MPNIPDSRTPETVRFQLPDENVKDLVDGYESLVKGIKRRGWDKKLDAFFFGEPEDVIDSDEKLKSHRDEALEEKAKMNKLRKQAVHEKYNPGLLGGYAANSSLLFRTKKTRRV
ncbi:hypothetical protein [Kiloniella majae]|uniref:hypothetical protein n=1 Tax=Kiloniella majae TaxID=1938558 RepID=UPI000A278F3E|nr:hypothetical protein [Kiloniella majae]